LASYVMYRIYYYLMEHVMMGSNQCSCCILYKLHGAEAKIKQGDLLLK